MKVTGHLIWPQGRMVYYVDGGTVVNNEFTRRYKNSQRPPHITRSEWNRAGDIDKWGHQKDWNDLFPDKQVKREFIAPKTKENGTSRW